MVTKVQWHWSVCRSTYTWLSGGWTRQTQWLTPLFPLDPSSRLNGSWSRQTESVSNWRLWSLYLYRVDRFHFLFHLKITLTGSIQMCPSFHVDFGILFRSFTSRRETKSLQGSRESNNEKSRGWEETNMCQTYQRSRSESKMKESEMFRGVCRLTTPRHTKNQMYFF